MEKSGEKQMRRPKISDKKQSEQFKETAREISAENLSDMFDKIIGEIGRNVVFPPCQGCGLAMEIAQITPGNKPGYEERMFRCPKCGVMEAKIVEIK
jgi:hypothetical protein